MSLISFVKEAGEKLFGRGNAQAAMKESAAAPDDAAKSKAANDAAGDAILDYIKAQNLSATGLTVTFDGATSTVSLYGVAPDQATKEKIALAAGNVAGVSAVNNMLSVDQSAPEAKYYTVVSGDNLSKISKAQYGDANKYMAIFEANRPMLQHPDKIYPGQVCAYRRSDPRSHDASPWSRGPDDDPIPIGEPDDDEGYDDDDDDDEEEDDDYDEASDAERLCMKWRRPVHGRASLFSPPPVPCASGSSWNASSRFFRIFGSVITSTSRTAAISIAAEIGRVRNIVGSPRDRSIARRRFSSIIGPSTNPSRSGAGSHPSFMKTTPRNPKKAVMETSTSVLFTVYTPIAQNSRIAGYRSR